MSTKTTRTKQTTPEDTPRTTSPPAPDLGSNADQQAQLAQGDKQDMSATILNLIPIDMNTEDNPYWAEPESYGVLTKGKAHGVEEGMRVDHPSTGQSGRIAAVYPFRSKVRFYTDLTGQQSDVMIRPGQTWSRMADESAKEERRKKAAARAAEDDVESEMQARAPR